MIESISIFIDVFFIKLINVKLIHTFDLTVILLLIAILIDLFYGEIPSIIHPVVIIGRIIDFFKNIFIRIKNKVSGLLLILSTTLFTFAILVCILYFASFSHLIFYIFYLILLSTTFSIKMLLETTINVKKDLDEDINKARESVSYLVSRNTNELTESFIISATIESMTENITDSYIAPVFYYFIFSVFLLFFINNHYQLFILLLISFFYRISNTLDAMVGYKTDELKLIGYFPAKLDDILNYIPSRIAGIYVIISSYLLNYNYKNSYKMFKRDARKCPSPNSGFTMATTAGALDIQLIKKETYILGDNNKKIVSSDVYKAVRLSNLTMYLFTITIILLSIFIHVII